MIRGQQDLFVGVVAFALGLFLIAAAVTTASW